MGQTFLCFLLSGDARPAFFPVGISLKKYLPIPSIFQNTGYLIGILHCNTQNHSFFVFFWVLRMLFMLQYPRDTCDARDTRRILGTTARFFHQLTAPSVFREILLPTGQAFAPPVPFYLLHRWKLKLLPQ